MKGKKLSEAKLSHERNLSSRTWRLSNLYSITNKQGIKVRFIPNWAQKDLYNNFHYLNVILKGRQIGLTTFVSLLFLDSALFTPNLSLGIIADTEENAKYIFRKIKFAYDCLPEELRDCFKAKVDSAKELTFNNNSVLRVGTSLRSSTFQFLLISEFGKIAAENPKRTNEIITGSLNTVSVGSYVFIESTARGREGAFYEMCVEAQKMRDAKKELSPMDYKFHFFPWWRHPDYQMQHDFALSDDMVKYFRELQEIHQIELTAPQRAWYAKKQKEQGDDIFREYPSTPEEAFLANLEGNYYSRHMAKARVEGRITNVSYDANLPVFVSMDLGYNDAMALWYFQKMGTEIRLLEYYENSGESLKHYVKHIKDREYVIEKVFAPHDASSHELGSGLTRVQITRELGLELHVLPKLGLHEGIDAVRNILNRCWFDERRCEKGIRALENYRKEWNELLGTWRDHPRHDHFSNGADSFRYLAMSLQKTRTKLDDEEDYKKIMYTFNEPQHPLYSPFGGGNYY
jgi:hypothetical protein